MGPAALLERLRALGVPDDVVDRDLLYFEPEERLAGEGVRDVCDELAGRGVRLFALDAFNPMLSLHGLDPNSTSDVEAFWRHVARPITRAGAAPVLLDHVPKNPDARGKYAYGSERKASGAQVHIGTRLLEPLSRGGSGRAELRTHKDRPGYLPRPVIGRLVLDSDGVAVRYELEADRSRTADGGFRPTYLMEAVSRALEGRDEPVSQRWLEANVEGKGTYVRKAIDRLVDEGYVRREVGANRRSEHTLLEHYVEADDPVMQAEWEADAARVPSLRSTPAGGE